MKQRPDYAAVVGQGRSGTNWLLELLDRSPDTFCRNEPYGASESPLNRLSAHRHVVARDPSEMLRGWDSAVAQTLASQGLRDQPLRIRSKRHLHAWSHSLGLDALARRPRIRATLARVLPSMRGEEWLFPRWLGSRDRLAEQLGVLKLVASPGWAVFLLQHRPRVPVLHIVRHPAGFLNSWNRRYLATRDREAVLFSSRARLREVGALYPAWADVFGDTASLDVAECELLYWRYANEEIARAGASAGSYQLVVYEALARDPASVMRRVYQRCGLPWSDDVQQGIEASGKQSVSIANAWREALSAQQVEAVERVLAETTLELEVPKTGLAGAAI